MSKFTVRKTLLTSAASVLMLSLASGPALAQETQTFDIDAQPLAKALLEFSEQSGVTVAVQSPLVEGKTAPPVKGAYEPGEALRQILKGSGLKLITTASGGYAITKASNGVSGPGEASEPVTVTGKLTDERTGNNLKGAQVTIEETGQTTSTDDLGNYRFPSVRPGRYILRVSYLGYQEILVPITVQAGRASNTNFTLTGGFDGREIVVYGNRSARAQSLNQERTAENSQTVLSADFLGNFDGDTISEALRRAPGVAFEQDSVTGDGTNVIVRGLAPDLNTVTLNGLRLPDGSGTERSADLSNILTDSISKITINKTLLPSQDSSGTGGLIEIETKGPLDRKRRFASLSVSGAKRAGGFRDEFLVSGTISGTFGADDNFGLSASVQYREQEIKRISYDVTVNPDFILIPYLPVSGDGTPLASASSLDPRTSFPFDSGVEEVYPGSVTNGFNGAKTSNLSVTISGQWKIGDHSNLRIDYTRAEEERDSFTRQFNISANARYELLPVNELGGELRNVLVAEGALARFGIPGVSLGVLRSGQAELGRQDVTNSLSFQGKTDLGSWEFDYKLGFAEAETDTPLSVSATASSGFLGGGVSTTIDQFLLPEALQNVTSDGRIVYPYAPLSGNGYPVPLINQAGFDFYNSADVPFGTAQVTSGQTGENRRHTVDFSSRYNLDGSILKYIEAGVFFEKAAFGNAPVGDGDTFIAFAPGGLSLEDVGLSLGEGSLTDIGINGRFSVLDQSQFINFAQNIGEIAETTPGLLIFPTTIAGDARLQDAFTKEQNLSAYFQARADIGKLEVVGGVRLDKVKIEARNPTQTVFFDELGNFDDVFFETSKTLVDQVAKQTAILPRLALTYRQDENLLIRLGYSQTIARPRVQDLSDRQDIGLDLRPVFGPNNDRPRLRIAQGNPDLKPTRTSNYDLSLEKYFTDVGQVKISLFYKKISNLLEQTSVVGIEELIGVELPDDPRFQNLPSDIFVRVVTPSNADTKADIWGVETAFEKQFTFLPGAWSGFGIFANYTYSDSSKEIPIEFFDPVTQELRVARIKDVPFTGTAKHSGTAALTYNKYGIDAALSFTRQARRLTAFQSFNLSRYAESDDSLDFRAEYRFKRLGGDWRLWVEGSDLLKGTDDPDIQTSIGGFGSTPKYFLGGNYFGGRAVKVGATVSF
ncbi:TonB-dependent receptor [Erythrobacter aureus]|uniref:TonB-dependent receptor n=1 Tax=Erythrobacter aureus TaxID=2182384 RepID=UPI003A917D63